MTAALSMPASLAWRRLAPTLRGAGRLQPAPQVPGYRVLREIGTGRRSSAWLATDLAHGGAVVLKLQAALGSSLHREWEIAARAAGEGVVRVLGHGRAGPWAWLAMEHVPGGDLMARLRQGVPCEQVPALLRQAAQGLAQLHRAGFVHRDVKPANFLLQADGALVLADFGLAAPAGAGEAAPRAGSLTGTPRYVAPEQLQGAPAAPAADVYSLGVLLHEMLCGRPPFAGETIAEVLAQHLVAPLPRLPATLAGWQPLLDGMLAKEAQCRLRDADAVLGLLGQGCSK